MPTYVYACDTCGEQFEKFQSFKDDPIRECPNCSSTVRRVFQPAGIVFKGSGWYVNDSRSGGKADKSGGSEHKSDVDKSDVGKDKTEKTDKTDKTDKSDASSTEKSAGKAETSTKTEASSGSKSDTKSDKKSAA